MRRTPLAARTIRLAWCVSFLATLAVVALLGLVRSAQAATLADPLLSAVTFPAPPEADEEAEAADEEEGEGCEAADEECGEETAEEIDDSCLLESAEATVLVLPGRDKVKLTLRYTAFSPALVDVRYSLRGGKGRLKMGGDSRRFGHRGVFRETEELSEAEMAKTRAATEFDVGAHAVNTPGYCRERFERRLTARHASHGGLLWTD
jgi:ribosomal protein L12E/L44/L45/RPP1/RPP2